MRLEQIETPALIVDLDVMEQNMDTMDQLLAKTPMKPRPHYKSNKCPPSSTIISTLSVAAGWLTAFPLKAEEKSCNKNASHNGERHFLFTLLIQTVS